MALDPLNKLCKWRMILAGWHKGTQGLRTAEGTATPGLSAMRDLMDKWLIMRTETSALAALLIAKGVFSHEEFSAAVYHEASLLDNDLEAVFPGFRTTDEGVHIYDIGLANRTMARLGFPP
jgi:hypothetical protein